MELERQLTIEQRVKAGAETLIHVYSGTKGKSDRKMLSDSQQMFAESKTKVEVLRMKIMKMKGVVGTQQSPDRALESSSGSAGEAAALGYASGSYNGKFRAQFNPSPEARMSLLRYKCGVETRLLQGAKSIMKANPNDRKSGQTVSFEGRLIY